MRALTIGRLGSIWGAVAPPLRWLWGAVGPLLTSKASVQRACPTEPMRGGPNGGGKRGTSDRQDDRGAEEASNEMQLTRICDVDLPPQAARALQQGTGNARPAHGLSLAAQELYSDISALARRNGWDPPPIISGYRSPEYQRELQARWDQGDRQGLAVRPSDVSAHFTGDAFDLGGPSEHLETYGRYATARGAVWGGSFLRKDPRHFQVRPS